MKQYTAIDFIKEKGLYYEYMIKRNELTGNIDEKTKLTNGEKIIERKVLNIRKNMLKIIKIK